MAFLLRSFGLRRPVEIIPNVLTVAALCFGMSSIRYAIDGDFEFSVVCLAISAVLDGLDGHAARALGASTALGAELDSLCDLADFGVSPGFVLFLWGRSSELNTFPYCLLYVACCALRLGRFNTKIKKKLDKVMVPNAADRKAVFPLPRNIFKRKLYFEGVPAPMGASLALTPIAWSLSSNLPPLSVSASTSLTIAGLLMLSSVPTFSSKMLMRSKKSSHLRSRSYVRVVAKGACVVGGVYALYTYPMTTFVVCNLGYLLSIPVAVVMYYGFAF